MHSRADSLKAFDELLNIMDELREKCPWDKKQSFQSLRHLTLEEVYELSDALLDEDFENVKKELGDVLLHLVFYSKIASELKKFDITSVIKSLNEKLIFRHPHIYGDVVAQDEDVVKKNWEQLKLKEGSQSVLSGVPKSLPSLIKAYRIQDKVKSVGFDFVNPTDAWKKFEEEIEEFQAEQLPQKKQMEFGDMLFSLINFGRLSGIDPDAALEQSNRKFIHRFQKMEDLIKINGEAISQLSLNELDQYWTKAKKQLEN